MRTTRSSVKRGDPLLLYFDPHFVCGLARILTPRILRTSYSCSCCSDCRFSIHCIDSGLEIVRDPADALPLQDGTCHAGRDLPAPIRKINAALYGPFGWVVWHKFWILDKEPPHRGFIPQGKIHVRACLLDLIRRIIPVQRIDARCRIVDIRNGDLMCFRNSLCTFIAKRRKSFSAPYLCQPPLCVFLLRNLSSLNTFFLCFVPQTELFKIFLDGFIKFALCGTVSR